jgi:sialic acid synthase SpsE/CMP-N-acetylneuraminic acid synthetase
MKNVIPLSGKPLIVHTIDAAKASKAIDRIIVSTEDPEIAEIAKKYGAAVPFLRPQELARDETPTLPVIQHALAYLKASEACEPEIVVLLQPTSPLRRPGDIDRAVGILEQTAADSVVSVCASEHHPAWMKRIESGRIVPFLENAPEYLRRQNLPPVYRLNGAIYVTRYRILIEGNRILGPDTRAYVMDAESSVDIDSMLDLRLASVIMQSRQENTPSLTINGRLIGPGHPPLVVAEIGINHEGDFSKAAKMIDDAAEAGCECVKLQCHVIEDEMIPNSVVPGNAKESIWDIMSRCALTETEELRLKEHAEAKGMIYLSTPFSRAAAIRLEKLGVPAYKIGSGECNNYPLIKHIASYRKPVILSTGMNDVSSVQPAVEILRESRVPFALMHCTSMYPTPYEKVRLGALHDLAEAFPDAVLGLSDHSIGNYTCFAAVPLGAAILEKHFTSDRSWPGPDVPISITPPELAELVEGTKAIALALDGHKTILSEEQPTIDFAYACVVSIRDIEGGESLDENNVWVKRPGTGEIKAVDYERVLGRKALRNIPRNAQIKWSDLG